MASGLPLDVFLRILDYSDQHTKYSMGLTCQFLSAYAFQKLWSMPTITKITSLSLLVATLRSGETLHPYKEWVKGLSIHMIDTETPIPEYLFIPLTTLYLKTLSLERIHIVSDSIAFSSPSFREFLYSQLRKGVVDIRLGQCTPIIIYSLVEAAQSNNDFQLDTLDIDDCSMEDNQLEYLAKSFSNLRYLSLVRCGCFSDQGLLAVARYCQEIQTLIVTLPSYFIQSNTITSKTINALAMHCPNLQQFVCSGQIRILEYIKEPRNHTFSIVTSV